MLSPVNVLRRIHAPWTAPASRLINVGFRRSRILNEGCFGLLTACSDGETSFDFVNEEWMWE